MEGDVSGTAKRVGDVLGNRQSRKMYKVDVLFEILDDESVADSSGDADVARQETANTFRSQFIRDQFSRC